MYHSAGEPPCIHHTICHAKMLAALSIEGFAPEQYQGVALPAEQADGIQSFPTVRTHLLTRHGWHATITDNDYQYLDGGHPTGGALSLLWQADWGPVLTGSMDPYRQNEPNNMQMPAYQFGIACTPRLELACEGGNAASSNDLTAWLALGDADNDSLWAEACGQLRTAQQVPHGGFRLRYTVQPDGFSISGSSEKPEARFYLPVVCADGESVFFPEANRAVLQRGALQLTVCADCPLEVPAEYRLADGGIRRLFNPVGGFQSVPLCFTAENDFHLTLSVANVKK